MAKQLIIPKLEARINDLKVIGFITNALPSKITMEQFPIKVILVDKESRKEYPAEWLSYLRFGETIPELLSYHSEGTTPNLAFEEIQKRCGITHPNQLAYYLYKITDEHHSHSNT
jgi:hypothetical protein